MKDILRNMTMAALIILLYSSLAIASNAGVTGESAANEESQGKLNPTGLLAYYSSVDGKYRKAVGIDGHQPALSPDRKKIAYIDGRDLLRVLWLEQGREVVFNEGHCSYASPVLVGGQHHSLPEGRSYRTGVGVSLWEAESGLWGD